VPAETLVYFEANSLPKVLQAVTETDAWHELAPKYKIDRDFGSFSWFNQFLAAAHFGSTETVILGRSQVAAALLDVAASDAQTALKIRPSYAVIIVAKSSRIQSFVETQISRFARQQFGEIRTEKNVRDNATWTIFRSTQNEKQIFVAVQETVAIVGNDEKAVQACLDTKNGVRHSLIEDESLAKARLDTDAEHSFVFGFVTAAGVKQLSQVGSVFVAGQLTENPDAINLLTQSLPLFVQKTVGSIGWTARSVNNKIEDRFLIEMPQDVVARLREPFAANETNSFIAKLIPAKIDSVTTYNFANPQTAWREFILAIVTKLDSVSAAIFSQAASGLLEPYGVKDAHAFLGSVNGEIATVKLSEKDNNAIAIAGVSDREAVQKSLKENPADKQSEFVDDKIILGNIESLQVINLAREQNSTIETQNYWQDFVNIKDRSNLAFVRTLSRDAETPAQFVKTLAREKNRNIVVSFGDETPSWVWNTSETRLVRNGFERRTKSAFGLIGSIAMRFNNQEK
jgi:hypothetical protein